MRKTVLSVAISLDGFIADPQGGVEWLHRFHAKGPRLDYGMTEFFRSIDTILMGRHTHDFALSHGTKSYAGMKNYVFTRTKPPGERDGVEYTSANPAEFVAALREEPGKNIWICGGGNLACQLLEHKLIDEIMLSTVPILLSDGIPLFQKGYAETELEVIDCKRYETGLVGLRYAVVKADSSTTPKELRKKRPTRSARSKNSRRRG